LSFSAISVLENAIRGRSAYGHFIETSLVAERFGVWQNVNILDIVDSVENSTSRKRIDFHITSWYHEVEDFDNAEVG